MWTYINFKLNAERRKNQPSPPPLGTMYRAFDAFRWRQVIGITERGIGCMSICDPNVDHDCAIIAFAPLDEVAMPDEAKLRKAWRIQAPIYKARPDDVTLLLANAKLRNP